MIPQLSVVVTAYNAAPFIGRCVKSLLSQTHRDLDLIIVDDGSTDATADICATLEKYDARIRLIRIENGGVSNARNVGIDAARGAYLTFVDGDDWVEPDMANKMLSAARAHDADIVVAGFIVDFHDAAECLTKRNIRRPAVDLVSRSSGEYRPTAEMMGLLGFVWNKVYRRTLIIDTGVRFDPSLSLFEDLKFNSCLFDATGRVEFLAEAYTHYVQRQRTTLVSQARTDFLSLRLQSLKHGSAIMKTLGANETALSELVASLEKRAVLTQLKRLRGDGVEASPSDADNLSDILRMNDVTRIFADPRGVGGLGTVRKWVWRLLAWRPQEVARWLIHFRLLAR